MAGPAATAEPGPAWRLRALVIAACAGGAALALFSGLDRLSADRPAAARWVPGALAADAQLARARLALASGDAGAAGRHAAAALDRAPLNPASSATLGAARLAMRDNGGADTAFRIAGKLGWRIFYTQAYWIQRSLTVGNYRVAALRLDALARQDPSFLRRTELFGPLETIPQGQAELAARLASAPWRDGYAGDVEGLAPGTLLQRAAVLDVLQRRGTELGCDAIAPTISGLIAQGAPAEAAALWRGHCPKARTALVYDGDFSAARVAYDRDDFSWSFIGQSDISMVLEPSAHGPGRDLVVTSTARRTALFARQLLFVAPGAYRLSWRATAEDGQPEARVIGQLFCSGAPEVPVDASYDPQSRTWSGAVTIDRTCPAHWLGFAIKPGAARFSLSSVRLEPARQASREP